MEKDKLTNINIKDNFYEKNLFWINKVLFFSIIFAPYIMILNDIYINKLVHNNNFWIKRIRIYFIFIFVMYSILWMIYYFRTEYALLTIGFIYLLFYFILNLQLNYGHLFLVEEKQYVPTDDELEKIKTVQLSDINEDNQKMKMKFRIIFAILFVSLYILMFNFIHQYHYLTSTICFLLIVGYDYFEQKHFKRDNINLFWKKRIMFYFLVLSPFITIANFLIYN